MTTSTALEDAISNALALVIDPELGQNIVDLGLVYEIHVSEAKAARIVMTTTTRGCPATDYLMRAAEAAAQGIAEVTTVNVELTYDPAWSPDMMIPMLKLQFGF